MLKTRSISRLLAAASKTRRGFTLLEIIVAVGAVALVSVGIAAIFDSVGKTVATGRRVSRNQTIASRVETQMRRDFSQITREGFLVIRQQVTSQVQGVASPYAVRTDVELSDRGVDSNLAARDRRVDEVLFFAKGNFTSAMEPLADHYVAKSNEAAIYYGHGERRDPNSTFQDQRDLWKTPRLDDDLGTMCSSGAAIESIVLGKPRTGNPNRYASDWILLRKPILLIQPALTLSNPPPVVGVTNTDFLRDSDVQIAGQPAASSIFQRLAHIYPFDPPTHTSTARRDPVAFWSDPAYNDLTPYTSVFGIPIANASLRPQISSGLVDIATTDMAEVRNIVTLCPAAPEQITIAYNTSVPPYDVDPTIRMGQSGYTFPDQSSSRHVAWTVQAGQGVWGPTAARFGSENQFADTGAEGGAIYRMHEWMNNALPQRSDGFYRFYTLSDLDPHVPGCRMRCESAWSSRDDVIRVTDPNGASADAIATYFKRRNQLALSAHNFIEHCSEFMVEWSFGLIDPRTGQTIWYGTPSQFPESGSDYGREMTVYRGDHPPFNPAAPPSLQNMRPEEIPYNPFAGMSGLPAQLSANPAWLASVDPASPTAYHVSKHLIYGSYSPFQPGSFPAPDQSHGCFTSHFGYFDPSFNPANRSDPADVNSPTYESVGISSLPWAWPKMVRITIRIADETDPTLEDTFQFVIDLPPTPHP